ncbi:MAG: hypothetical protein M1827_000902 [Pycnora praestabilis]|nr:MAG: hypothetical protein M1827_000902 [Pycnora praestabilis]
MICPTISATSIFMLRLLLFIPHASASPTDTSPAASFDLMKRDLEIQCPGDLPLLGYPDLGGRGLPPTLKILCMAAGCKCSPSGNVVCAKYSIDAQEGWPHTAEAERFQHSIYKAFAARCAEPEWCICRPETPEEEGNRGLTKVASSAFLAGPDPLCTSSRECSPEEECVGGSPIAEGAAYLMYGFNLVNIGTCRSSDRRVHGGSDALALLVDSDLQG